FVGGPPDVEAVHRSPPGGLVLPGDLVGRATFLVGPGDDLVVDVGHVADEVHLDAGPGQVPADDVPHEGKAAVTDMGLPVHRRTAHIHRQPAGLTEVEFL